MNRFFQNYNTGKRIILHLCFWFLVLGMQFISYQRIDIDNSWILFVKDVFSLLTIFYVTAYIIIPRWFIPGKFVLCILWLLFIYAWWSFLSYFAALLTLKYLTPDIRLSSYLEIILSQGIFGAFRLSSISDYLLDFIFLVALPLTVKIVQAFMSVRNSKMKLELKNSALELNNVQLELAFLKYQINPHFLLNTLYSIYVLVSDHDERGGESMMRLSSIMVYLLHESNQPRIEISREFQLLKDYVELEKLRYSETVQIKLNLAAEDENSMMVPLIFFPFVENAFKHGPRLSSSAGWISIDIKVRDDKVYMHVANAYRELSKPENYIGGLGIENVKKRLELHYPYNHNLEIKSHEGVFSVNLVVTLHSETEP
ncbi:histidine kinase [Sphingobacterium paramultivorum]|uniref:Histidine kinase n=1 Tax=Sphingobacterium paramultivorum TaxID=2886510 RepID=A0A7G5E0X1_9SPHI|nr:MULTISPECIES: histidine kinase [Sphingobacterium]MCS4165068.1 sensor histidine kinase YesM [Sphingobacterium sp. BIGb0116]QMV67646.1 histidine kinase [Sphingobacterium paramultivorum]WSO16525.1 histidine kinase [Sphingobacterium paramultivorum]